MPTLLGPNGQPLMVSTDRDGLEAIDIKKRVDWETADSEVNKRVRSQGTSLSQVWDPRRGKPKPTSITFDTLRMISNRNEWCAAIIKTRLNQIGKIGWSVKPKDDDDSSPATEHLCDEITRLLRRPSLRGSRPHSRSWRQFIGEVLRDILVLDAGCIEKERNGRKWIVAMYPVDGATVQPNIDDRGGYPEDAYVQIVDGQVTARFGMEDLVYIMDNPQTDVKYAGYGYSPLEWLLVSVTAELYAAKYNSSYFEKGAVPEGMINLGEEVAPEDVDAFRLYWMNEIMGKPWALPIVGGKGVEWIPWRQSNKDMEYMSYQQWLLKKMCAVYQLAPQEIGELEDVNRSTANEQQDSNQTKSIEPILTLVEDYFEVEIIGEHGLGVGDYVKFEFDKEDDDEAQVDQAFSIRVDKGAASRNEWREAVGMEPSEEEGADMLLVGGQLNPLPTEQDLQALSASGQQQHQQEMAEQQAKLGGGPGSMPWKPGDQADPDLQAAQSQHETENGLGPKQLPVGKTAVPSTHSCPGCGTGLVSAAHHGFALAAKAGPSWNCPHCKTDWRPTTTRPMPHVAKTDGPDRNPALTEVHEDLEDVFDAATDRLAHRLERILGVPAKEAEALSQQ
jgi:HK97 family phage portal protein